MKRKTITYLALGLAPALFFPACAGSPAFDLADSNDDLKVSPKEFERYMLESVFAEADGDGNGQVTFEEWKAANPDADPDKFRAPDTNGDKMVSPEEAEAHFKKEGTWADLFDQIDTDSDGFISSAESVAFKEKMAAQSGTSIQKLKQASSQK
jgi:Ca2+-binding EF-hand superfamily protein